MTDFQDKVAAIVNAYYDGVIVPSYQESKYTQIQKTLEQFSRWECIVSTGELFASAPRVNKTKGPVRYSWCFVKDRLFIVPTVTLKYLEEGSTKTINVRHADAFDKQRHELSKGVEVTMPTIPQAGGHWLSISDNLRQKLIPLVHETYGERLDILHATLCQMRRDVELRIDELIATRRGKSKADRKKFQDKLVKFLKTAPSLVESSPDFIMECFQLPPRDLEKLQKFLRSSTADINFIAKEDISEAQLLAQVEQVQTS